MNPKIFKAAILLLYGPGLEKALHGASVALAVNPRNIQRMASGTIPVPAGVAYELQTAAQAAWSTGTLPALDWLRSCVEHLVAEPENNS